MRVLQASSLALLCLSAVLSPACGGGEVEAGAPRASAGQAGSSGTSGGAGQGQAGAGGGFVTNVDDQLSVPKSCAYTCPAKADCNEATAPYVCPSLVEWGALPHLAACGAWDGKAPAVVAGQCKASAPTGDAAKRPGPDPDQPGTRIMPDGRTIRAAGSVWEMQDALKGGMTAAMISLGNGRVATVDIGNRDHGVRVIDTKKIGVGDPVLGLWKAPSGLELAGSLAATTDKVWVATAEGKVEVLAMAPDGALTHLPASALMLPLASGKPFQASAVALSKAGVLVSGTNDNRLLSFDPATGAAGKSLELAKSETFAIAVDPKSSRAYVTLWSARKVVEVDLDAFAVTRTFSVGQNPQGMDFLGDKYLVVANDYGESLSIIDRDSGTVSEVLVRDASGLRGLDVSHVSIRGSRAYVTQAGVSAVAAFDVDATASPPTFTPLGRLPTPWWPSSLTTDDQGDVIVASLRGPGIGPFVLPETADGDDQMRGAIQKIPTPSSSELSAGDAAVIQANEVGKRVGYPTIDCPPGVSDFPVPRTNGEGASSQITRVVFVVRENKTFDSVLGDLPGLEGDPSLTLLQGTAKMDQVWPNFRALVKTFSTSDNFYNLAVKSTQGHMWTTYGRATDFCERTWASDARSVPLCGVGEVGRPEEGSLFDWLGSHAVDYDILGEIVGVSSAKPGGKNPVDTSYPGGAFQTIPYVDLEKACYAAARARAACDLGKFVYMTLPNDHTVGLSPKNPSPEVMIATNDEATGMLIDALSHDPLWAKTLVIITEDDPQQGGDHVDYHRTPIAFISPWIKRGYVSKTHIDVSSLFKLFSHVLGLPYPNLTVKNAGLPLDLFTSTPDYTPFTYMPRKIPLACGTAATSAEIRLTESWDFSQVDAQPGLGDQVRRALRGEQYDTLPAAELRRVEEREARKAAGLPAVIDDGD